MTRFHARFLPMLLLLPMLASAGDFGQPSNPAGVWELTIQPGVSFFSFPILPPNPTPDNVLGDQFPGGQNYEDASRIVTYVDGELRASFFHSLTQQWEGDLDTLTLERGYWMIVDDDHDPVTLRLVGGAQTMNEVVLDTLEVGLHAVAGPALVPVTLPGSGLTASGFAPADYPAQADRVWVWQDYQFFPVWHDGTSWTGATFTFAPGSAYLVERLAGRTAIPWVRPALTIGAQPPDVAPLAPSPELRSVVQELPFDLDTAPWETRGETIRPIRDIGRAGR